MYKLHACYVRDMDSQWRMKQEVAPYNLLIFITKGQLMYGVDNEPFHLQKGDVFFIPAGSLRGGKSLERHQRHVACFTVHGQEKELLPLLTQNKACKLKIENFAYFKQRFSQLSHHWRMKGPFTETICYAILLEMLCVFNNDLEHKKIGSKKMKLVHDLKNYIVKHYQEPIKLRELADFCGKTPNYISYVFKEVTGFTPIEYLHDVRISVAKDLMLTRHMSIREISECTGFCDQAYFTRVFKKMTGYSPSTFIHEKSGEDW